MNPSRRGFLLGAGGILALAAAPAIVRADSLMRIVPLETEVLGLDLAEEDDATFIAFMHPDTILDLGRMTIPAMRLRSGQIAPFQPRPVRLEGPGIPEGPAVITPAPRSLTLDLVRDATRKMKGHA